MSKEGIVLGFVLGCLSAFFIIGLVNYFDRPTVEISVDTGHCVRAYGPKGPMSCRDAMNQVHEQVLVDPKKFKKVLRG